MDTDSSIVLKEKVNGLPDSYYKLLVENIADYAVFMLNPEGHIVSWNKGAELIKQYKAEDVIGKHFSLFYTSADIDRDYPATELREALKQGHFEDEGWRVRKDGSVFWANVIITPVYDETKQLIGFSKVTRNLSERKKAEDELYRAFENLKESEERFRLLIEGVMDYAIFMLDANGRVASWNEGAKRLKGYEAKEIIGKFFSAFYSQEDIQRGFPEYELEQAKSKGRFEDEGWRYKKDGTAFWANTVLTALYNDENELIGFSKITRDLTDKKKLEQQLLRKNEELKESEERIRLLVESVKDYAILMLSPDGIIMSWNAGAERIKGYNTKEIVGKHFSVFYDRQTVLNNYPQFELKKALANGRFEDEGWRIRKDGTAFWANVVLTPIYTQNKALLGFAKITRDLTERQRNEELMQRNQELVRINNELDNFVYTASHDLKSPVINLEGLLQALEEDMGADKAKHKTVLGMMGHSIQTLKNVIADLTDITRLQYKESDSELVNLPDLIEEIKASIQDQIVKTNAVITTDFSGFSELYYSRKNLRSILFNLLSNAVKYADPGRTPQVSIRTYLDTAGEQVVSVTDNGLGIKEKHKEKLFSMYKRFHDHVEGSGIGLYLVKKILNNSGDSISVHSELGEGSEFKIFFKSGKASLASN